MSPPHVPKVVFFSVSVTLLSALSSSNLRLGLWAFSCVEGGRVQVVMPCLPQMLAVLAMDWGGGDRSRRWIGVRFFFFRRTEAALRPCLVCGPSFFPG